MLFSPILGAAMAGASYVGLKRLPQVRTQRQINATIHGCDIGIENDNGTMRYARVVKLVPKRWGYVATIELPIGYASSKFQQYLEQFEQSTGGQVRMRRPTVAPSQLVFLDVGLKRLYEKMPYRPGMTAQRIVTERRPTIPFYTPYGLYELNFWDEASTHLLIGGVTRMGKSVLVRLLVANIMHQLHGDAIFVLINNKIEDLFPFEGIPQIVLAETEAQAYAELLKVHQEVKIRKQKLREVKDSSNIKQYRQKHPNDPVPSLFVVVDEYGRFADSEDIQNLIIELAETGGSYDVHLILASQRPDAATVLKPRAKANLLARIAFSTADEANSAIIIGTSHAARLGGIKGRACLLDGMLSTVQVPFISEDQTRLLLDRFKGGDEQDGAERPRQENPETPGPLPGFVEDPDRDVDLP